LGNTLEGSMDFNAALMPFNEFTTEAQDFSKFLVSDKFSSPLSESASKLFS
jgi:hypothetical protein